MYKKYAGKTNLKNYVLVSLVFVASAVLAVWLTFYTVKQQLNAQITQQTVPIRTSIENLLDETRKAARLAESWTGKECSRQLESQLNAVITRELRMLVVNLLKGDQIYCSSLLDNKGDQVNLHSYNALGVKIDDSNRSAGVPAFSLYQRFAHGGIVVSADLRYLWGIIGSSSNNDARFALLVNNNLLTQKGIIHGAEAQQQLAGYDARFSTDLYTLVWRSAGVNDIWRALFGSWFYLLIIITLPLVLTALTWLLLTRRRSLYQYLINAVHDDDIVPYYQPIVCASSNRVVGAEILARWDHPEIGFIPPDIFISVAEKTQTIGLMTENLLKRVIADCQHPDNALPKGFIFNVNISNTHLTSSDFCAFASEFGARFKTLGQRLTFEFTENEQIELNDDLMHKIKVIRDSGIAISLDDFGTGFSNLSWISSLSPDSIKIDRMFINQISPDASTPLINCVIDMAKQMGIKTVAEGVEHDYQAAWLQENNIDYFQGYYYSRPLPFSDFMAYYRHDALKQYLRKTPSQG